MVDPVTKPTDDAILGSARISLVALRRLQAERFDADRDKAIADLEIYLQTTDGVVDADGTIYDSKALNEADWQSSRQSLIDDGWQFLKREAGVIYIRKRYGQS
jgi:hypothetical protein